MLKWIKDHRVILILTIAALFVVPLFVIHWLFKLPAPWDWLIAEWEAGDLIQYYCTFIAFIGTVYLGYSSILQGKEANETSKRVLELEWKRQQPCFDVNNYQKYNIYLGEAIDEYKEMHNLFDTLVIEPAFLCDEADPMHVYETSVALMDIEITNSGNSDIREWYIKDMDFYLNPRSPLNRQKPFIVSGNKVLKKNCVKRLVIDFKQQIDETRDVAAQLEWIQQNAVLMPRLELKLHIRTVDNYDYDESIILESGWHQPQLRDGNIQERTLHVFDIQITRRSND